MQVRVEGPQEATTHTREPRASRGDGDHRGAVFAAGGARVNGSPTQERGQPENPRVAIDGRTAEVAAGPDRGVRSGEPLQDRRRLEQVAAGNEGARRAVELGSQPRLGAVTATAELREVSGVGVIAPTGEQFDLVVEAAGHRCVPREVGRDLREQTSDAHDLGPRLTRLTGLRTRVEDRRARGQGVGQAAEINGGSGSAHEDSPGNAIT